jgi:JmjC domain, hydroxylase
MRHKTTLIFPAILLQNGIKVRKMAHRPGEFMITRPSGYHAGFNHGFNIAEAVNFAVKSWIKTAVNVQCCKCVKDSVSFNMGKFIQNVEKT